MQNNDAKPQETKPKSGALEILKSLGGDVTAKTPESGAQEAPEAESAPNDAVEEPKLQAEEASDDAKSAAEQPEGEISDEKQPEAEKKPETEKEKRKRSVQERINKALEQRRLERERADAAERRARELEERLAALEKGGKDGLKPRKEGAKSLAEDEPDPDEFELGAFDPAYQRAVREYERKLTVAELRAEQERLLAEERQKIQQAERQKRWQQHLAAGAEKYDDFEEKVLLGAAEGAWEFPQEVAELVAESEIAPDVVYHLATNPEEASRLAALSAKEQARYIGRLEGRLTASKAAPKEKPKPSKAPEPLRQPRGVTGKFERPLEDLDFKEFYQRVGARRQRI